MTDPGITVPRAGGLRLLRIAVLAVVIGVFLNSVGVLYTFKLNADRVDQINQERARNVLANCLDINARHDNTIRLLDELIAKAPPERRDRSRESRASTQLLIAALVPKRQCEELVRRQIGP